MQRRTWPRWGALLACLALGCGLETGDAPPPEPDAPEGRTAPLVAEDVAGDAGASCGPEDLGPGDATATCGGPWEYGRYATCSRRVPECGPLYCPRWSRCESWEHGFTRDRDDLTFRIRNRRVCENVCEDIGFGGRPLCRNVCSWDTRYPRERCEELVDQRVAERRRGVPSHLRWRVRGSIRSLSGDSTVRCQVRVDSIEPRAGYSEHCGCAEARRYPSCTLADPACGERSERIYSSPGLDATGLRAEDEHAVMDGAAPPVCTTCDELPHGTPAEARAKLACLRERWDALKAPASPGGGSGGTSTGPILGGIYTGPGVITIPPPGTNPPPPVPAPESTSGPGAGTFDPALLPDLARRMRLLYELHGGAFDAEARAFVRGLYADPEYAPACQTPAPLPGACELDEEAHATFARCEALAAGHAAGDLVALELFDCAALLERFNDLVGTPDEDRCDGPALREGFAQTLTTLTARALRGFGEGGPLDRAIYAVDRWDAAVAEAFALGAFSTDGLVDEAGLAASRSEMLGRFWEAAQQNGQVLAELGDAPDLGVALGEATERGLEMDRRIVTALATPRAELAPVVVDGVEVGGATPVEDAHLARGAVLTFLLGDAMGALSQRLADIAVFHDFAATFGGSSARSAPAAALLGWIGHIDDPALGEVLEATDGSASEWWYAFDALHDDAAHLRASVAAQAGSDARIGALAPDELPAPLRVLAERVQAARARYEAYLATGQLEPTPRRTLFAGVHEREREQMLGTLGDALGDLEAGMARHERDLEEVVRGLLTLSDAEARRTRVQARLELVAKSWDERARELAGLLAAQGAEDARLGELTDALASLEGALDAGGLVPVGDTARWTLSGASATADGVLPRSPDWAELAAAQLRVQPGQVLQLEAQGEWSPTCALRGRQVYDEETRAPLAVEAEGALIGPEGFRLSRSASGWVAEEHSDTTSTTGFLEIGATFQACSGTTIVGGAQGCVYANAGARWSATESNTDRHGSDTRTSASFSAGLRVPNAPLPELPVGALLLVEVPPGGRVPRDVHIVRRPRTTVVVSDGEADLYAFVNDTACAGADGTNELVVTARLFEGEDVVARRSLGAIEEVLATIRAQEPTVVAQGRVLPSQLGALRSEAYHRLRAKTGLALGDMPDPMVGLFDAFLSKELLRLERAVAIDQLERELDVLVLELASLHEEVLLLDQQTRLATLIPTWTLRNLDGEELRGLIADVVGLARRYLFPVLELWYPDALARLATSGAFAARLEALRSAGPTTRTLDLVREVRAAMELILSAYRGVLPGHKDEPSRPLVAAAFRDPSRQAGATELSALPKADEARSEVVWRALRDLETGTFTIDPEDVYSRFGGAGGRLACTEAVPVIERMALVVVRNGDDFINQDYNFERRWLSGRASVSQPFVEEDGLVDYTLGNQVWQSFQIPVLYGRPSEPLEVFATRVLDAGGEALPTGPAGLSPFGSLEIDFQGLAALRGAGRDGIVGAGDDAFEVALVMQVDSRSIAEPVDWLAACDPTIDTAPGGGEEPPGGEDEPPGGEEEPPFPTGDEPPFPTGDEPPFPTGDEPPFPTF